MVYIVKTLEKVMIHSVSSEEHLVALVHSFLRTCVAVLCLDQSGCVAAGVSTSGPPFKLPGRVGDSPLPGCGLYADNSVSFG